MKLSAVLFCAALALCLASCQALAVRPLVQYSETEVEYDGRFMGISTPEFDEDIEYTKLGIEVAFQTIGGYEIFGDISRAATDSDTSDAEADGYELGAGIRSPWPTEQGWGLDWGARIHYEQMEDDDAIGGTPIEDEIEGYGVELTIGPYYAIEFADTYIISPHGGLLLIGREGTQEIENDSTGFEIGDFDFEQYSAGLYGGVRINSASLPSLDVLANLFIGTDDLLGIYLSAGIRF
jgi:hypothetical protein